MQRIDPNKNKSLLQNLQSGILRGHSHNHSLLIFIEITKPEIFKNSISLLPITTAFDQESKLGQKPTQRLNIAFTNKGYSTLGIKTGLGTNAFKEGMKARAELLADKKEHYPNWTERTDALLILSAHQMTDLTNLNKRVRRIIVSSTHILNTETGIKYTNGHGQIIEHFGYADGISQPRFLPSRNKNSTNINWDDSAPLDLVLTQDIDIEEAQFMGSYLVYRKLEQDVKKFKNLEDALATRLGYTGQQKDKAGALVVGRWEDGSPVWKQPNAGYQDYNDFNYQNDPQGTKCPFHSHIRKTNPRGEINGSSDRDHRIARRAITYGKRKHNGDGFSDTDPDSLGNIKDVGLLFMCYQSDIENQFEFMQRHWANNPDFRQQDVGIDPVIGQGNNSLGQQWPHSTGDQVSFNFASTVQMKGGLYLFTPSIPFLTKLPQSKNQLS